MHLNRSILLSSAYLGPVSYYAHILQAGSVVIEAFEHYSKQTYRNRCRILTSNGVHDLIIPVIKVNGNHTRITDIEIAYAEKWQMNHWRAIVSAYSNAPYFLFYQEEIEAFYRGDHRLLLNFNSELLKLILDLMGVQKEISKTGSYLDTWTGGHLDCRQMFNPKRPPLGSLGRYTQVFEEKWGFQPDLSVIDLLFNLGPDSKNYLLNADLSIG